MRPFSRRRPASGAASPSSTSPPTGGRSTPRVTRASTWSGRGAAVRGPVVHLNGHFDVVPAGDGWTVDPFGGVVRDGRIYGRGVCDMKAGIAAARVRRRSDRARRRRRCRARSRSAARSTKRAAGSPASRTSPSAGASREGRTDFVIIPEPLNVDRICVGHRGVYWFEVTAHGRIGHGSMPFLGVSAIDGMGRLLQSMREELLPALALAAHGGAGRAADGARHATINVNGIDGGQPVDGIQTPCVADRCRAVFDRRFLIEEGFDATKAEIAAARAPRRGDGARRPLRPSRSDGGPPDAHAGRLAGDRGAGAVDPRVLGRPAELIASPGTYDHKHVARIAGVPHCVAYGPGRARARASARRIRAASTTSSTRRKSSRWPRST